MFLYLNSTFKNKVILFAFNIYRCATCYFRLLSQVVHKVFYIDCCRIKTCGNNVIVLSFCNTIGLLYSCIYYSKEENFCFIIARLHLLLLWYYKIKLVWKTRNLLVFLLNDEIDIQVLNLIMQRKICSCLTTRSYTKLFIFLTHNLWRFFNMKYILFSAMILESFINWEIIL